jgi:4-hydroxy-tetrahydrodipicolinate synthase
VPRLQARLIPALVAPFHPDGSLDLDAAARLAQALVTDGCDALLINGTTGEAPTLDTEEKIRLFQHIQTAMAGKQVPILAGVGSNDTRRSVQEARQFAQLGADALLVVVPYYNKPTQAGMLAHFTAVAQAVPDTEIVIYNIPSRCVVLMSPDTIATLHARCPNIIGVKQSHPDMDAVSELAARMPTQTWHTWSGDDSLTLPMMACGAHGTFSVLAHLAAARMRRMIDACVAGDLATAQELHRGLLAAGKELFFLPNPTVVKTALARLGKVGPTLRLPMVPPTDAEVARIDAMLDSLGLQPRVPVLS